MSEPYAEGPQMHGRRYLKRLARLGLTEEQYEEALDDTRPRVPEHKKRPHKPLEPWQLGESR